MQHGLATSEATRTDSEDPVIAKSKGPKGTHTHRQASKREPRAGG